MEHVDFVVCADGRERKSCNALDGSILVRLHNMNVIDDWSRFSPTADSDLNFMNPLDFPVNDLLFAYWWARFREEIGQGIITPNYIDTEMHRLGKLRKRKCCIFQFDSLIPVDRLLAIKRVHLHNTTTGII